METSNLKNMVVLKNLPSNIVDEAIIVLKANKKTKKLQKIENKKILENQENKKDKEYILKEAEMIVNNYISKIENKDNSKIIINKDTNEKYKNVALKFNSADIETSIRRADIVFSPTETGNDYTVEQMSDGLKS